MAKEKFDFIQPIKDIPRTLKGFPKNIGRIVKDRYLLDTRTLWEEDFDYIAGAVKEADQ